MSLAIILFVTITAPAQSLIQQDQADFIQLMDSITTFRRGQPIPRYPASRHQQRMARASPAVRVLLAAELRLHTAWNNHAALIDEVRQCVVQMQQAGKHCELHRWAHRMQAAHYAMSDACEKIAAAEQRVPGRSRITDKYPCFSQKQRLQGLSYQNEINIADRLPLDNFPHDEAKGLMREVAACSGWDPHLVDQAFPKKGAIKD